MKSKFSDLFLGVSMSGIALLALAKGIYFVSIFCGGIVLSVAGFKLLLHYNTGNKNFDYRKFKGAFLLTGFAIVFATLTSAFNYNVPGRVIDCTYPPPEVVYEEVEIIPPITKHEEPERQEAPPPIDKEVKLNKVPDVIKLVDLIKNEPVIIKPPVKDVKTVYIPPKDKEPIIDIPIDEPDLSEDIIVDFAEVMPEFPGGAEALLAYIASNIKYPTYAKEINIQGRVFIEFIVEKDGSVTNATILKDIGYGCGDEAVRVVETLPNWAPGKQGGKNVRVRYRLPVKFKLQ